MFEGELLESAVVFCFGFGIFFPSRTDDRRFDETEKSHGHFGEKVKTKFCVGDV